MRILQGSPGYRSSTAGILGGTDGLGYVAGEPAGPHIEGPFPEASSGAEGTPGMVELENPAENPCFGCGPRHPRGLRLRFERSTAADGADEIVSTFTPRPDEIGWPTVLHHGLHFLVLYETSYWTALTLGGKLWVSHGPITYTTDRLPRVGVAHVARGRLVAAEPGSLTVEAASATREGKPCGTLRSSWKPASREAVDRAGIPLPEYLRAELSP